MAGIKITQLAAYSALGANETTVLVMVDPADPTMAPSGTTRRVTGSQVVGNYQGPTVAWPNAAMVIGPDPGGTQRFRVSGSAWITQNLQAGGNFQVDGSAVVSGQLVVPVGPVVIGQPDPGGSQILRVAGALNITQGITDGGGITVAGAAALNGGITVTGTSTLAGAVTMNAQVNAPTGPVIIGADPGGSDLLRLGGDFTLSGTVRAGGDVRAFNYVSSANIGQPTGYWFQRPTGLGRWLIAQDASVETGGNIGSNLVITAFNDAGGSLFSVLTIRRASGQSEFRGPVLIGTDPGSTAILRVSGDALLSGTANIQNINYFGNVTFPGGSVSVPISVAVAASASIVIASIPRCFLFIMADNADCAMFALPAQLGASILINAIRGNWSATNVAANHCIFFDGTVFQLLNNTSATRSYWMYRIGSVPIS